MLGKIINGYRIDAFIGKGQFGEVYKATKNGQTVAIKFIRKEFIRQDIQEKRLLREIAALQQVKGSSTVALLEDGEYTEGSISYRMIVMEYVDGKTLREIRNGDNTPWPSDKAVELITLILNGLNEIHQAGVIHRDLKPENIKITSDGKVKILDYGLSKVIDYSTITQTGQPIGTFFYMSPEQIKGEKPIKPASDYYSVGVILYELLTGRIPFHPCTAAEIIYKTINVKPPLPSSINPSIDNSLENIVLKLLSKEMIERYSSIDEIVKALHTEKEEYVPEKAERVKFYLRVIQNDTTIVQNFLTHNSIDGVDFPINLHAQYKTLYGLLRKHSASMDFFADPSTNRMAYTHFRKTKGLRELPYAPEGYDALTPDAFDEQQFLLNFVENVIELQVSNGCNILTAPFFFFNSTTDDWYQVNIKLLRESIDYVHNKYPQYAVSGAVCTTAELLCRQKERKSITEDYGNCKTDYLQLYIEKISENIVDAQLYNFIGTAKAIKDFNKTKLIACRVPPIALSLLTVGFDAVTSGLGVLDNFTEDIIIKEEDNIKMPTKYYFPELLLSVPYKGGTGIYKDILSQEQILKTSFPHLNISLNCTCNGCQNGDMTANFQKPRLHFLYAIQNDIKEINSVSPIEVRKYINTRIDTAYSLQMALIEQGVKLAPHYLNTWKEIINKY